MPASGQGWDAVNGGRADARYVEGLLLAQRPGGNGSAEVAPRTS